MISLEGPKLTSMAKASRFSCIGDLQDLPQSDTHCHAGDWSEKCQTIECWIPGNLLFILSQLFPNPVPIFTPADRTLASKELQAIKWTVPLQAGAWKYGTAQCHDDLKTVSIMKGGYTKFCIWLFRYTKVDLLAMSPLVYHCHHGVFNKPECLYPLDVVQTLFIKGVRSLASQNIVYPCLGG